MRVDKLPGSKDRCQNTPWTVVSGLPRMKQNTHNQFNGKGKNARRLGEIEDGLKPVDPHIKDDTRQMTRTNCDQLPLGEEIQKRCSNSMRSKKIRD